MKKFNAAEIVELNLNQTKNGEFDSRWEYSVYEVSFSWCKGWEVDHKTFGPQTNHEDNGRGEVKTSGC